MRALITGITGQDGSYLAEFLLKKGYEVHGIIRRSSTFTTARIDHIYQDPHSENPRLFLHYGDLSDSSQITNLIHDLRPDEIYNLAAQSHVGTSFDIPEYTSDITALGATRVFEAVRRTGVPSKVYQASSSEMFGTSSPPQNELTPFRPRSPYAVSKLYAYWMARNYREGFNIFICNGILFNHESPRRGLTFVTKKITRGVAEIKYGKAKYLYLGNLDSERDWGYAPEFVEAMWLMLQQEKPDDYVIGTGETHSVRDFLIAAFEHANLDFEKYVKIDSKYYRPTELNILKADTRKAEMAFGWKAKTRFKKLVKVMVDADLLEVGREVENGLVD